MKRIYRNLVIWLALIGLSSFLYADELLKATAAFDKGSITIGDKVRFTITVEYEKGAEIKFPVIDNILIGNGFAIRDFGKKGPVKIGKGRLREEYWYLLDIYTVGAYKIPPIDISYRTPEGAKDKVTTNEVLLEVKSVMKGGEGEDIRDIKEPVEVVLPKEYWWIWVVIMVVAVGSGVGFWIVHRKKKTEISVPEPPDVVALRALEGLKEFKLDDEESVKEYYIRVSSIVRHYIEDRFSLEAPERTTEEFLSELAGSDVLGREHKMLLREFLRHCDLVKFAKYLPTQEEVEKVYNSAKKFVEETRQVYNGDGNKEK